jgi:hypothetical protein
MFYGSRKHDQVARVAPCFRKNIVPAAGVCKPECLNDVPLDHEPLSRGIASVPWSRFITATKEIEAATFDPHRQPNGLV